MDENLKPLAFRAVFVFSTSGNLLFSQRFASVECRIAPHLPPVPANDALANTFRTDVVPLLSSSQSVFTIGDSLNLIVMTTRNLVLSVVPLIDSLWTPPIEFSASFSFLNFLETISRPCLKAVTPESRPTALAGLRQLVNQVLPFGIPVVHDVYFASQLTSAGDVKRFSAGYQVVAPSPVPSWKTFLLFQRMQLDLKLREVLLGSIDGQSDAFDVYGEIRCVASLNYLPDVALSLPRMDKVENVSCHYCVKKIDGPKIIFSPPTGISQILIWKSTVDRTHPPVDGKYEIIEDEAGLHFALTINVHPPVKNITAQLPFPGRGSLTKHQFQSPGGQLKMSKKEASVMWSSKLGEEGSQTLSGVLSFEAAAAVGREKYRAYVSFKSKKRSFSGLVLEKEGITLSPASTVNVTTDVSFVTESKRYIFWETAMPPRSAEQEE
jgi:AP-5 complex subunit mu-1